MNDLLTLASGLFAATLNGSSCGCYCIDGVPKTLCASVASAQQNPQLCPPQYRCSLPDSESTVGPVIDIPHPDSLNCRAVRIWRRDQQAYAGVNVCDVLPQADKSISG